MTPEEACKEAQSFVDHMLQVTLVLVRKGIADSIPNNWTSGFLLRRGEDLLVVSNGHFISTGDRWWMELRAGEGERPPLVPVPGTYMRPTISSSPDIFADAACWRFPASELLNQGRTEPVLDRALSRLAPYAGPITGPTAGEAYGFAAWNRNFPHGYVPRLRASALEHEASSEVHMAFEGNECVRFTGREYAEEVYRFGLARLHQGDKYYDRACGAPIAERDGRIVSMVVGGNQAKNCIYGLPLTRYFA